MERKKQRKRRIGLQKVIRDSRVDEIKDSIPEEEISIDPNDVVACEIPLDEDHLGIGAMIGFGSLIHHLACGKDEK